MEETQLLLPGDVTWGREAVTVRPLQAGSISFHVPDIFMQHRLSWLNADLSPGFLLRRFKSAQLRFFTLSKDVCFSPQPFRLAIWRLPSPAVSLPCCGGNEPSWTSHVPCLTSGKVSCWGVWESLIFAALRRGRSQLSQLEPSYKTLLWKHSRFFLSCFTLWSPRGGSFPRSRSHLLASRFLPPGQRPTGPGLVGTPRQMKSSQFICHEIKLPRAFLAFEEENSGHRLGRQRAPPFLQQRKRGARLGGCRVGAAGLCVWAAWLTAAQRRAAPGAAEKAEGR